MTGWRVHLRYVWCRREGIDAMSPCLVVILLSLSDGSAVSAGGGGGGGGILLNIRVLG